MRGQAIASISLSIGLACRVLLDRFVEGGLHFTSLFPAVVVAGLFGGTGAGITTTFIGGLLVTYLWLPPQLAFQLTSDGVVHIVAFWSVAALVILLTSCIHVVLTRLAISEQRAAAIARELQRRVHKCLSLAEAIAQQTFRCSELRAPTQAAFSARLAAIGRAHDLMGETPDKDVWLEPLIVSALGPFDRQRFSFSGPSVQLDSELAIALALLIHELASNALRYGALSNPAGRIEIAWTTERPTCQLTLTWKELFGPPVILPSRVGYGSKLLRAVFAKEDGAASLTFEPDGVRCTATFPIRGG